MRAEFVAHAGEDVFLIGGIVRELGDAVILSQRDCPLISLLLIGDQDTTFACGKELGLLKAEAANVAQRSHLFSVIGGAVGVGAILDHFQSMFFRHSQDAVHVAGVAPDVNQHDRFSLGSDALFNFLWGDAEGLWVYIAEYRDAMSGNHRHNGCPEGVGGNQNLVAGLNAGSKQRRMQGRRSIVDGEGIFRTDIGRKTLFKFLDQRRKGDLPLPHQLFHRCVGSFRHPGKISHGLVIQGDCLRSSQ